ncbi:hypothetical protein Tco_0957240 [Tanacetum coccineum]
MFETDPRTKMEKNNDAKRRREVAKMSLAAAVKGRKVQNDGKHSIDEKSIAIKKPEVSVTKESYLSSSRRGDRKWSKASIANRKLDDVDFGWSNAAAAKVDCTITGLLYDLRYLSTSMLSHYDRCNDLRVLHRC